MKVMFTAEAFKKFRAYVDGIEYEISGFGKVEKRDKDLWVTDIKIFDQLVTSSHTEMDARALAKFFDDLLVAGEDPVNWKLWWHSHVEMPAFFSATDDATIDEFDTEEPIENWMLSIVTNKRNLAFAQVNVFQPIRCVIPGLIWNHEDLEGTPDVDVAQEIKDKVKIRVYNYLGKETICFLGPRQVQVDLSGMTVEEKIALINKNSTSRTRHHGFHYPLASDPVIEGEIL